MGMQTGSVTRGTMLLGVYAIGLGLPFILSALFISRAMGVMNQMKRHMGLVEKIMGGLLVLVGVLMLTGGFSRMSYWLLENLPMLGNIG